MHFTFHASGDSPHSATVEREAAAIDPATLLDLAASGHMPAWTLTGDELPWPSGDSHG